MMRNMDHDDVGLDMTIVCERLAERLRSKGAVHPVAAAVALVARGHRGLDVEPFATAIGIDARTLSQIEQGGVAFADLPDEVAQAFACIPSASLFLMADLEVALSSRTRGSSRSKDER